MPENPVPHTSSKRLGAMLLEAGLITEGQLNEALKKKAEEGGFLGKLLVEMGYIRENDLIAFLVKQCKIPHISLTDYEIHQDLVDLIGKELCRERGVLPIDKLGSILTVAMVDPLDVDALEAVREACPGLRIKPILCSWFQYEQMMRRLFPQEQPQQQTPAAEATLDSFGLLPSTSKTRPKKIAAPEAIVSGLESTAYLETYGEAGPPPKPELAEALGDPIREAVRAAMDGVAGRVRRAALEASRAQGVPTADLTAAIRGAVQAALDDAAGGLLYQVQNAIRRGGGAIGELSADELSDYLRQSMREAFQAALFDVIARWAAQTAKAPTQA